MVVGSDGCQKSRARSSNLQMLPNRDGILVQSVRATPDVTATRNLDSRVASGSIVSIIRRKDKTSPACRHSLGPAHTTARVPMPMERCQIALMTRAAAHVFGHHVCTCYYAANFRLKNSFLKPSKQPRGDVE